MQKYHISYAFAFLYMWRFSSKAFSMNACEHSELHLNVVILKGKPHGVFFRKTASNFFFEKSYVHEGWCVWKPYVSAFTGIFVCLHSTSRKFFTVAWSWKFSPFWGRNDRIFYMNRSIVLLKFAKTSFSFYIIWLKVSTIMPLVPINFPDSIQQFSYT